MASAMKPLGDRVVLKPRTDQDRTSAGGIIIPDTAREKPQVGEVVAVGPGKTTEQGVLIPVTVKVGQSVVYSKYAGTEYKNAGEEYLIVRSDDILAVVG